MKKPNIVFILADDMGQWAMGCSGNEDVFTPNLDKLALEGTRFDNFFCASPVCSPARASILTGSIPSEHGVHDYLSHGNLEGEKRKGKFVTPKKYIEHLTSYTELLQQDGYRCALSGKWHLGDSINAQSGFNQWYTIGRGGCNYMDPDIVNEGEIQRPQQYVTDLITQNAKQNIDNFAQDKDTPFYLSVHYTAPHSPWGKDQHKPEHWNMYDKTTFTSTPDEAYHPLLTFSAKSAKGEGRKKVLRGYYTAITAMDEGIGEIVQQLKDRGVYDDTIIIFTADNGMNMGHHGLYGKGNATYPQNLLDTSVKIPFIMAYKGKIQPAQINSNLFSHYDIMPTLIDLLELKGKVKQELIGKSFAPILRGETQKDGSIVIIGEYGMSKMIRTKEYKLIIRDKGFYDEFYDLSADPDEKNNLIKNETLKPIMQKMKTELMDKIENYSTELYRCDGIKNTGVGQAYAFDVNKSKDSFVALVGYKNYARAYAHRWRFRNYKV